MKNAVLTAVKDLIAQKGLLEKQIQDTNLIYFIRSSTSNCELYNLA